MAKTWLVTLRDRVLAPRTQDGQVNPLAIVTAVGAIGVTALALWAIVGPQISRPSLGPGYVYYYDLSTEQIFTADSDQVPPIVAPSGHLAGSGEGLGVRAAVFSCGDCNNAAERFVAYLEKYPPDTRQKLLDRAKDPTHAGVNLTDIRQDLSTTGLLISLPDGENWVSPGRDDQKEDAQTIMASPTQHCAEGQTPMRCFPAGRE